MLDTKLKSAKTIVTGCVKATPTECLPLPDGIMPPLKKKKIIKSSMERYHANVSSDLYQESNLLPLVEHYPRHEQNNGQIAAFVEWVHQQPELVTWLTSPLSILTHLSRQAWCQITRLRTGFDRFRSCHDDATSTCGEVPQTAEIILAKCNSMKSFHGKTT